MKYDPHKHHRNSIRLKGYDYSQNGAYYITICVQNRENRFGQIQDGKMVLNDAGKMIDKFWVQFTERNLYITLDEFVVMPNHLHGIIIINNVGAPLVGAQTLYNGSNRAGTRPAPTIGNLVGEFKSNTTHEYIVGVKNNCWNPFNGHLWQRNYYEHIIRNDEDLNRIREYILNNPVNWEKDELYV